jgi:hypothetical protein
MPSGERQFRGGLDSFNALERRYKTAELAGVGFSEVFKNTGRIGFDLKLAYFAYGAFLQNNFFGKGQRGRFQIAFDNFIQNAHGFGLHRRHRRAGGDYLQG